MKVRDVGQVQDIFLDEHIIAANLTVVGLSLKKFGIREPRELGEKGRIGPLGVTRPDPNKGAVLAHRKRSDFECCWYMSLHRNVCAHPARVILKAVIGANDFVAE